MYKLYYSPGSCSLAVHILLLELKIPHQLELISIRERSHCSSQYLAINAKGRVPALAVGEQVLTETMAISVFLAQHSRQQQLLPADPLGFAKMLEWYSWLASDLHAMAFSQLWRAGRFSNQTHHHAAIANKGLQNIQECFAQIERQLQQKVWVLGDQYSVLDPYLLVFFLWGEKIGLPMAKYYPAWQQQRQRMLARPAVEAALTWERRIG